MPRDGDDYEQVKNLLYAVIAATFVMCIMFIVAGLGFIYLGAVGNSDVTLFGQKINSGNVGIVSVFFGAIVFVVNTRAALSKASELISIGRGHFHLGRD